MLAPAITDEPASKLHRILPVEASIANIEGTLPRFWPGTKGAFVAIEAAYTTPLTAVTGPGSTALFGSGVRQSTFPVSGSIAAQRPPKLPLVPTGRPLK